LVNPNTKQKFDKDIVLVHENGYWNIRVDFGSSSSSTGNSEDNKSTRASSTPTEYICPSCKNGKLLHSVADRFKGWGCEKWKDGCKFNIPAEICGISMEPYLEKIARDGNTDIIENFTSKKGNRFSAKLSVKNGKLEMEFPSKS
jgi:DNA topoisomerase-3